MWLPIVFQFGGVPAGIKPPRPDVALFYSAGRCTAAGVFTTNKAKAAPVADAQPRLPGDGFHAVVVNSGNANALTGAIGLEAVARINAAVAAQLGVPAASVVAASTGVIGVKLPADKIIAAVPRLIASLAPEPELAADAIMTTDTARKLASRAIEVDGRTITLAAIAKGSGMIAPQLATVITVLVTDAALAAGPLQAALAAACTDTFNHLTIDGDTSTNDSVIALANGAAGAVPIDAFTAAARDLFRELARAIAADGEGATKRLEVRVTGAPADAIAADLARAIAGSTLVKAAMFGADPNWGRVLATVGARAGSQRFDVDPYHAKVALQGVAVYDGGPVDFDRAALRAKLREPEVAIAVDVRAGTHEATAWGCDLSYDYVKINADYTSLIVETPDGSVRKDDRLTNYSPKFKVTLLVEALSYIDRFRGQRCVVTYGAAMTTDALVRSFCDDILLLRSVGLHPIVVHGRGPDDERQIARMGGSDDVVEMVMTGAINTELVTLLNRKGGHAVGLSGKDGGMLRPDGERIAVDGSLVELMLDKGYVPVISPGTLDVHVVAAELAVALRANKLIYLESSPGFITSGNLVSELARDNLAKLVDFGAVDHGFTTAARAILRALAGGVGAVHLLDGRTPHSVIAELFTDSGVGTVVR